MADSGVNDLVEHALRRPVVLAQDTGVAGDRFEEFFLLEQERLLRALYLVSGNRSEAEDVMQEAFVRVLERWDTVRWMDNPTGYLYRTAMNTFRTRYRRGLTALRRLAFLAPRERDLFKDVEVEEDVRRALSALTPRQRAAVVLTELLGYTSDEAAEIMAIKASTVRVLAVQARARLQSAPGEPHE
jgi:RNA polymerase sigma factor (sigma-70 family)